MEIAKAIELCLKNKGLDCRVVPNGLGSAYLHVIKIVRTKYSIDRGIEQGALICNLYFDDNHTKLIYDSDLLYIADPDFNNKIAAVVKDKFSMLNMQTINVRPIQYWTG